jgi:hypothetical protein
LNSVVIAQNGHSVGLQQQNLGKLCGELGVLPVLSVGPGVGHHQSEGMGGREGKSMRNR